MASAARRRLPWAVVFVAIAESIVFWGALARGETFAERDLRAYYRPAKTLLEPLWRTSAGLPLWNPLFSSGQPFAANPEHEVFHPLSALFLILPFEIAFRAQVILPPLAAGWAMYLLARTLRRSRGAATLGAVAWAFGGYLLSTTNLLPILLAASVLPAVLAFSLRYARASRGRDLAGLAVTTGLVGLAGEPSTLLMLPVLIGAALLHDRLGKSSPCRGSLLRPAFGLVIGLGLAAATLVPGLLHASKTIRAGGLDEARAGEWSLPPVRLLELLSPHVMGHVERPDEAWYWGRGAYPVERFPFLYSIYPGITITALGILGAFHGSRRLWPWLATATLGVLLSVGVHGPVWPVVRSLPVLSGLRYPEKFALLVVLPLVVVALHGFDHAFGPGARRRRGLLVLFSAGLTAAITAIVAVSLADARVPRPWVAIGLSPHLDSAFANVARGDALRAALLIAGALALLRFVRSRRRAGLALVALTSLDLASAGRALTLTVPVAGVADPPLFLRPALSSGLPGPVFHLAAEDPDLGRARGIAAPPIPAQWGIAMTLETDFDLTFLSRTELGRQLFWDAVRRKADLLPALLERRGVFAVVKFRAGSRFVDGIVRPPPGAKDPLEIARVAVPRPLVFPVNRVKRLRQPRDWTTAVLGADSSLSSTAHIDDADGDRLPSEPSRAEVTSLEVHPGRVTFDVRAHGPKASVLAINQTWDEGWNATVNGEPARLLVSEVSLSALALAPGHHHVELEYRDRWVQRGLLASGASLLVLILAALVPVLQRSRSSRPATLADR
jgi:hypothetical protein